MGKICFVEKRFNSDRVALIKVANEIVTSYSAQGYRLTLVKAAKRINK